MYVYVKICTYAYMLFGYCALSKYERILYKLYCIKYAIISSLLSNECCGFELGNSHPSSALFSTAGGRSLQTIPVDLVNWRHWWDIGGGRREGKLIFLPLFVCFGRQLYSDSSIHQIMHNLAP